MKTSIATVRISGDFREKLAAIASAGFDGVENFENDFLAFDGTPAEVGRMISPTSGKSSSSWCRKNPHPIGLQRIDHVAQTMNYEEMLSWVLFYVSIFRTGKLPIVDVVDPGGLVRSQVIESSDGGLRLSRLVTLEEMTSRGQAAGPPVE